MPPICANRISLTSVYFSQSVEKESCRRWFRCRRGGGKREVKPKENGGNDNKGRKLERKNEIPKADEESLKIVGLNRYCSLPVYRGR